MMANNLLMIFFLSSSPSKPRVVPCWDLGQFSYTWCAFQEELLLQWEWRDHRLRTACGWRYFRFPRRSWVHRVGRMSNGTRSGHLTKLTNPISHLARMIPSSILWWVLKNFGFIANHFEGFIPRTSSLHFWFSIFSVGFYYVFHSLATFQLANLANNWQNYSENKRRKRNKVLLRGSVISPTISCPWWEFWQPSRFCHLA